MTTPLTIFWFRRDLRLDDNHGLFEALSGSLTVLPVFIFDTDILDTLSDRKDARLSFIHEQLFLLNKKLTSFGSSLYIFNGTPQAAFRKLFDEYDVRHVIANHDYEPYSIRRDHEVSEFLKSKNIAFSTYKDQVIFEKDEILKPDGKPYTVFTPYSVKWKSKYPSLKDEHYPCKTLIENFLKTAPFRFPSLKEIGFENTTLSFPSSQIRETIISDYHNTRNIPSAEGTSRLSVHLRFGTISIRKLARIAFLQNEQFLNELIWREFFMMILYHFPFVVNRSFKPLYDEIIWRNNETEFDAWCKGETGYPIVDAGMRELNQTGFMHNRVRMITAGFLTKHLLIDWRRGEAYFAEKLLDFELSSNNGNWQWSAGSGCDAAPYFRIFNPFEQTKRFDPDMVYIKKWIDPDNCNFKPLVEHEFARKRALETYKKYLIK